MSSINRAKILVRVKNIRIGEKKSDHMHNDEFTMDLHRLANTKITAKRIYPNWYEGENLFLHSDWVEVIKK